MLAVAFEGGEACFEAFRCPRPECRAPLAHRELRAVLGAERFAKLDSRCVDR
jgi:hypothetical protein